MKQKTFRTAIIVGGTLGLLAAPAWSQYPPRTDATPPAAERTAPGTEHWGHAGMTEKEIEQVQHALRARGYQPGDTASLADQKTQEAIRNFQRDQNIPVTGTLDERTAALLGVGPFAAAPARGDVGHGPPAMAPAGEQEFPPEAAFWGHTGMSEEEIRQVQRALRQKGYDPGAAATVTDRQTRQAIMAFQRDYNLPMTGSLDERTASLLGVQVGVSPDPRAERPGEPRVAAPATPAQPRPIEPERVEPRATPPAPTVAPDARAQERPGEPFEFTQDDLKHLQEVLKTRGYNPGTQLNLRDKQMMEAIRNFQRDNNLTVTGAIDQKTAALLGVGPYAAAGAPDRPEKLRPGGDDPPPAVEWWGHHGMTEQEVQQVQKALRDKGYAPGNVAVATDPKTREAIRQFQRDNNLPITGTLDERTAAVLGITYKAPADATPGTTR